MIVLSDNPTVSAPVALDGDKAVIDITFRVLIGKRQQQWLRAGGISMGNRFTRWCWRMYATYIRRRTMLDWLDEVIVSWDGVVGDADESLDYSKDRLRRLMEMYPFCGMEIIRAYTDARSKGLIKN